MKLYHKILVSILITTIVASLTVLLVISVTRARARKGCASELTPDTSRTGNLFDDSLLPGIANKPTMEAIEAANLKYKKCLAEKGLVK